jgi:hypothetical protein
MVSPQICEVATPEVKLRNEQIETLGTDTKASLTDSSESETKKPSVRVQYHLHGKTFLRLRSNTLKQGLGVLMTFDGEKANLVQLENQTTSSESRLTQYSEGLSKQQSRRSERGPS